MFIFKKLIEAKEQAVKQRKNFKTKQVLDPELGERFAHEDVTIDIKHTEGKKPKTAEWFTKHVVTDPDDHFSPKELAQREVVAQEFFRLMIPHQPKTRILLGEQHAVYVSSKGVPGFTSLEKMAKENPEALHGDIINGRLNGLGKIMVYCLFVNEVDLKLGNIGVDAQNHLVKIDGDWAFAAQRDDRKRNYAITPEVIANMPLVTTYDAMNWLDVKMGGTLRPKPTILTPQMALDPKMRAEINSAMLNILIMPKSLLEKFVKHYALDSKESKNMLTILTERSEALRQAALKNDSFVAYLRSPEAELQVQQTKETWKQFIFSGKTSLVEKENINELLGKELKKLQASAPALSNRVVAPPLTETKTMRKHS